MRSHEAVGPERDAALVEPFFDLLGIGLENAGSSNHHLKLTVHSTEPGQDSFSHFANELDRESPCLAFGGNTVFGETSRPQLAGQRRWPSPIPDDFDFFSFFFTVMLI